MLVVETLKQALLSLCDEDNALFKGFPDNFEAAANNFGEAIHKYGSLVTPPSTSSLLAKQAFVSAFVASEALQSMDIVVKGVQAYAAALAPGMAPAFAGIVPTGVLSLQSVSELGVNGGSAEQICTLMATLIDTYFRTGTAINTATGVVIPWT